MGDTIDRTYEVLTQGTNSRTGPPLDPLLHHQVPALVPVPCDVIATALSAVKKALENNASLTLTLTINRIPLHNN
jgi:hypothetical protein